ncbi:MAG: hypothetical protein FRX49_02029 [Trebouxia sp. A1-2]|nr:MAG: hypothetical protein FRX49_02029 [Trebouxia sp. A1-2]
MDRPSTEVTAYGVHDAVHHEAAANSALFAKSSTLMPTQDLMQGATKDCMHLTLGEDTRVKHHLKVAL